MSEHPDNNNKPTEKAAVGEPSVTVPSGPITDLEEQGDVPGLLELASAYRRGTDEVAQDLGKCLQCYLAAARLESADGEYSAATFYISGTSTEKDVPRGVSLLRGAASKGHLGAKIYLGNIYQIGIHYEPSAEKADVWYRSAARAAGIDDDPGSPEYNRAMAAIGSVREFRLIADDESIPKEERLACFRRAKVLGFAEFQTERKAAEAQKQAEEQEVETKAPAPVEPAKDEKKKADDEPKTSTPWTAGAGVWALLVALFFFAAATVAGFFAAEGVRVTIEAQGSLPVFGAYANLALPLALVVFGFLPTTLVYRPKPVLVGICVAAMLGGVGWYLSMASIARLLPHPIDQTMAFAAAGYLVAIFPFGLRRGTRSTTES
jgi:hypothetical protein